MRNNKIFFRTAVFLILSTIFLSCKKEKLTQTDINKLNPDNPELNTALDQWLKNTFLDEYNVDVIYRYNRYNHEADRNLDPPNPETVMPMMLAVLKGYIMPYRKIGGETFIKRTIPKQWVLFGSTSYDGSGTGYAGTASGGVRINLFGLNGNNYTMFNRLGVIHHEFTHILNQLVPIPEDFPLITKSTYNGAWQSTSPDSAHKWGYVSNYASQNPMEDYAETTSALLVNGQPWFDNWVKTSASAAGQTALRLKEQNVVGYFNSAFNIDFRALQKEIQVFNKDSLKETKATFPYWINNGLYKTITINLEDGMYNAYDISPVFAGAYNQFKKAIKEWSANYNFHMDYLQLRFDSPTSLVVRVAFTSTGTASNGTQFLGDYSFSVNVNSGTGETQFVKVNQASGTTFDNGGLFMASFVNTIQEFLTEDVFIADWLPTGTPASMYTKTAGFYQKMTTSNYFYGTLGQ